MLDKNLRKFQETSFTFVAIKHNNYDHYYQIRALAFILIAVTLSDFIL